MARERLPPPRSDHSIVVRLRSGSGNPHRPRLVAPPFVSASGIDLVFYERASTIIRPEDLQPVTIRILTGPEGGRAEDEVKDLAASGWLVCMLPVPVLRAETAVVVVRYCPAYRIPVHLRLRLAGTENGVY